MRAFQRHRALFALAAIASLAACTSWRPYPYELRGSRDLPARIRLNLASLESVQLRSPFVEGDTALVGKRGREVHRVLLRDVVSFEVRETNVGRTTLLVLSGLGLFLWALCADGTCIDIFGGDSVIGGGR